MTRFLSLLALVAFSFTLSAADNSVASMSPPPCTIMMESPLSLLPKRKATVSAGTIIYFETTSSLNSREVSVGTMVPFRVTTNVKAEREIVITTGTQAMGRVKKITKATFNSPEVIEIEVKYVQAVDGTQIPLSTNPIRLKGTFPNQGFEVAPFTSASSVVMDDTVVYLK